MDRDLLLKPRLAEEDVDIPGVGTVRVRALSRAEVLRAQKAEAAGPGAIERVMLAAGMVDPTMTEAQVTAWQEASPAGELEPVTRVIQRLSGLDDGAAKESYKSPDDDAGS